MSLLIVGSLAYDCIETPSATRGDLLGGSALYCAGAASCFSPVQLVSIVGNDWPEDATEMLARRGVDISGVSRCPDKPSYRWHGRYGSNMNDRETISLHLNAYGDFDPVLPAEFRRAPFVFLANLIPTIQLKVLDQLGGNPFVVADTHCDWFRDYRPQLDEVFRRTSGLTVNDSEAEQLTGKRDPVEAGYDLLQMGPDYVIVKQGTDGVTFVSESSSFSLPAFQVANAIDPTGAGDSFAGGMMGYVAAQNDVSHQIFRDAIIQGVVVASFAVEDFGFGRLKAVDKAAVNSRVNQYLSANLC